jgi:hypothetical protein
MQKRIQAAIEELRKHGYSASESNIGGFIRVADPFVITGGGKVVQTGFDDVQIHHTKVFEFLEERS